MIHSGRMCTVQNTKNKVYSTSSCVKDCRAKSFLTRPNLGSAADGGFSDVCRKSGPCCFTLRTMVTLSEILLGS